MEKPLIPGRKPGGVRLNTAISQLRAILEQQSSCEGKALVIVSGRRPDAEKLRVAVVNCGQRRVEVAGGEEVSGKLQSRSGQLRAAASGGSRPAISSPSWA
jgi:hypothetical protein